MRTFCLRSNPRGIALVVVLVVLAWLAGVAVAFLSGVTIERDASKTYAHGLRALQISDSALHQVMGAVKQATSQGREVLWASQPGMIRTYGAPTKTASSALSFYKLYSSDRMVVGTAQMPFDPGTEIDARWRSKSAFWTDLNAPVLTQQGAAKAWAFPIVSGVGIRKLTRNAAAETVPEYLGYDLNKDGIPDVDGFAVDPATVEFDPAKEISTTNQPVPMPVRWIYTLRDGTLTVPDQISADGLTATWSDSLPVSRRPTASNPLVGRMAYWTDDESAKLNLNTAGEGSPWGVPRFASQMDLAYGRNGPAQREYQRYPGHPAGVSLSPVFGSLLGLRGEGNATRISLAPTLGAASPPWKSQLAVFDPAPRLAPTAENYLTSLFSLTPRYVWGGSRMGTVPTAGSITGAAGISRADLKLDRLYASVDEALFAAPGGINDTPRQSNNPLTAGNLEMTRFFLTTSSRAPEVTPFNQPKVTIWPVDDPSRANPTNDYANGRADSRSPLDQLIGVCSTVNQQPYYFTRNNPFDPAGDFTPRNRALYDYLVNRLSSPLPGYGQALSARYPGLQVPQMVTEIYDYIRGATNLNDSTAPVVTGARDRFVYSYCKPMAAEINPQNPLWNAEAARAGVGEVVPFAHPTNGTKGVGRFPTIQQAVVLFVATAANQPPLQVDAAGRPVGPVVNPLHPFPRRLPTAAQIQQAAPALGGAGRYRFSDNSSYPYPTLYSSGAAWFHAPSAGFAVPKPADLTPASLTAFLSASRAQTHSGLRFLTEQNPITGAFDLPNPRYRGPSLGYGQTQMQAVLFFSMSDPAAGNPCLSSHYKLRVAGADQFQAGGFPLNLRNGTKEVRSDTPVTYELSSTGVLGFGAQVVNRTTQGSSRPKRTQPLVFYSDPVVVSNDTAPGDVGFQFGGGEITVELLNPVNDEVVQTARINFPSAQFPTPLLLTRQVQYSWYSPSVPVQRTLAPDHPVNPWDLMPSTMLTLDLASPLATDPNFGVGEALYHNNATRFSGQGRDDYHSHLFFRARQNGGVDLNLDSRQKLTCDTVRAVEVAYGDTRLTSVLKAVPSQLFVPHRYYFDVEMPSAHSLTAASNISTGGSDPVFRGGVLGGLTDCFLSDPNNRRAAYWYDGGTWNTGNSTVSDKFRLIHSSPTPADYPWSGTQWPAVTSSATFEAAATVGLWPGIRPFSQHWLVSGDYDNGVITGRDGPFINKPEEGMSPAENSGENPYFGNGNRYYLVGDSVYSPNRQVASAVSFGSLPAGVNPSNPSAEQSYRTLLFCPNPNAEAHPALGGNPPDHALLDFFHMPVVEPYAISEPFSTAGKVNMNYQIAPFGYLKRQTAIRGVLRGVELAAVPDRWITSVGYPAAMDDGNRLGGDGMRLTTAGAGYNPFRYPICEEDTLQEFERRFALNDIFRAPSEICGLWLYPARQPTRATASRPQQSLLSPEYPAERELHAAIRRWWYQGAGGDRKSLTGDNTREAPYGMLYPRLTTKSNSYTVHVKAQSLVKTGGAPNTFREAKDTVAAEFRGSYLIERYLDPNDPAIPDFTQEANRERTLDAHYRFRVLGSKKFSP